MQIRIINWHVIVKRISKETGASIKDICLLAGISGNAAPPAQPRYDEGEILLDLFLSSNCGEIPYLTRDAETRCPSCSKVTKREDLIRIGSQLFRCIKCLKNSK